MPMQPRDALPSSPIASGRRPILQSVLLISLAFAPGLTCAAEPAVTHVRSGTWQATDFRDPANPGCSIGGPGSVPGGRLIMGANRLRPDPMNLIVRKTGWAIPEGAPVQVQATFPGGSSLLFSGRGKGQAIEIDVPAGQMRDWVHGLTASAAMQLSFAGTEPPWVFDLTGTSVVINAMDDCFRTHGITGVAPPFNQQFAGPPTQLFAAPPSTQPFAYAPQSQPYAAVVPLPGDGGQTGSTKKRFGPLPPSDPAMDAEPAAAQASPRIMPPRDADAMPDDEAALLVAVEAARRQYQMAANDMARGSARPTRAQDICRTIPSPAVSGWVGTIAALSTNSEGKGVLSIQIAPRVLVKTWSNAVSDYGDGTLIDPASPLFRAASLLQAGQRVRFSASLIPDRTDCFREASTSLAGSIAEPEFIMRLEDIQAIP